MSAAKHGLEEWPSSKMVASRLHWSIWRSGPDAHTTDEVFVIVSHFQARQIWDLPRIIYDGLSLRRRWNELPGAVGVWLWIDWRNTRTGSVSVWRSEKDMRNFVRWAPHVKIMKGSGRTGRATSKSWSLSKLDRTQIRARAVRELSDWNVKRF